MPAGKELDLDRIEEYVAGTPLNWDEVERLTGVKRMTVHNHFRRAGRPIPSTRNKEDKVPPPADAELNKYKKIESILNESYEFEAGDNVTQLIKDANSLSFARKNSPASGPPWDDFEMAVNYIVNAILERMDFSPEQRERYENIIAQLNIWIDSEFNAPQQQDEN